MNAKLFIQGLGKFLAGILLMGALIFLPAWSLHYWQGWLLMGILFVPMFVAGIVRHPMYMSTLVLFLAMPLVLGSIPSFAVMLLYIPIIAKRIRNEEAVLEEGLPGYREYKTRVRYKVIPFIW